MCAYVRARRCTRPRVFVFVCVRAHTRAHRCCIVGDERLGSDVAVVVRPRLRAGGRANVLACACVRLRVYVCVGAWHARARVCLNVCACARACARARLERHVPVGRARLVRRPALADVANVPAAQAVVGGRARRAFGRSEVRQPCALAVSSFHFILFYLINLCFILFGAYTLTHARAHHGAGMNGSCAAFGAMYAKNGLSYPATWRGCPGPA